MDDYLSDVYAPDFDPHQYLYEHYYREIPPELREPFIEGRLKQFEDRAMSKLRRKLTRNDPLLFALLYFPHHLCSVADDGEPGPITLSRFHVEMCQRSRTWARTNLKPQEDRHAEVAPRESGKTTWNFLIRPMWALAHRHRKYVLAFADMGKMAEQHLMTFKRELAENELLRKDHPALCTPAKKAGQNQSLADRQDIYISTNHMVFQARGIDSTTLGAKFGSQRPDLLLFDDVEPDASNYSELQKDKRLHTLINAVFPMNLRAVVVISGTVNMTGAIVHDLVRQVTEPNSPDLPEWPSEERIQVHYYPALYENEAGEWESVWPQRWPVEWMREPIFHGAKKLRCQTASFLLSMQNSPRGADGGWFTNDDFRYGSLGDEATRWLLQIDPAVTTKEQSDFTALVVVGFRPPRRHEDGKVRTAACEVSYGRKVKVVGEPLRTIVLNILERFPRIKLIRVEANQGGEMWLSILHHMPVRIEIHNSDDPKEVRIARSLDWYQRGRVWHTETLNALEEDQIGYPKAAHDDLPDCAALGINYFLQRTPRLKAGQAQESYV